MDNDQAYLGPERRDFLRLDYVTPLNYKVCKEETINKLLEGYTVNVSQSGLMCSIEQPVRLDDILWLSFDKTILNICEELEQRAWVYQNGIIGKVVRIMLRDDSAYELGIKFLTREEQSSTHIYPQTHFLFKGGSEEKT